MAIPGMPGSALPQSEDSTMRRLRDTERSMTEERAANAQALATNWQRVSGLIEQVNATLANIDATVSASITANSYTRAAIDSLVANPPSVASTGPVSGTTAVFNGGIKSTDVYSRLLTYGGAYKATYVHADGTLGYVPSSRAFKQDIATSTIDPNTLTKLRLVTFRYIAAVENLGADAEVEMGVIAEEIEALGLTWLLDYDENGNVEGVKYAHLVLLMIPWAQSIEARLSALESVHPS